jgi:hypothetical protein
MAGDVGVDGGRRGWVCNVDRSPLRMAGPALGKCRPASQPAGRPAFPNLRCSALFAAGGDHGGDRPRG